MILPPLIPSEIERILRASSAAVAESDMAMRRGLIDDRSSPYASWRALCLSLGQVPRCGLRRLASCLPRCLSPLSLSAVSLCLRLPYLCPLLMRRWTTDGERAWLLARTSTYRAFPSYSIARRVWITSTTQKFVIAFPAHGKVPFPDIREVCAFLPPHWPTTDFAHRRSRIGIPTMASLCPLSTLRRQRVQTST